MGETASISTARRAVEVSGVVQGVGFRPFVFGLAESLGLAGFVGNRGAHVIIEVEGPPAKLDSFVEALAKRGPPLAVITDVTETPLAVRGETTFAIIESDTSVTHTPFVSPDVATCDACLEEVLDPSDRRHRYALSNCTNCGPRLTIVTAAPYDRARTTMAGFPMCNACRGEYEDPRDRRYHAQPIACPRCGPELRLVTGRGASPSSSEGEPIAETARALLDGAIVAIKGIGGYHLACMASNEEAVAELRRRKQRDEKPFAVMAVDIAAAEALCDLSPGERTALLDASRPIVVARRRDGAQVAPSVAPKSPWLGVMLPYTPLAHLLLREVNGAALVMTSGNVSDEPIAYEDDDAARRLGPIADRVLSHDRPIHIRCDDSVIRIARSGTIPIRRARGMSPAPIPLGRRIAEPILALGGQSNVTFAIGSGSFAFLSHHLGDLDHYAAHAAYVDAIAHYERLLSVTPALLVHDLHPDWSSTAYAVERSRADGIPRLAVQHHHAHVVSCMVDAGLDRPVLGVAFDGTGYGPDGTIWGGEVLVADRKSARRGAHLRAVPIPTGEKAIVEVWRMALSHLADAGLSDELLAERIETERLSVLRRLLSRRFHSPLTSSAGRLFDAVASMIGLIDRVSFGGQAAMMLEQAAARVDPCGSYELDMSEADGVVVVDTRPIVRGVASDVERRTSGSIIARRFHSTMADIVVATCSSLRADTRIDDVVLSGGVFSNVLLADEAHDKLTAAGFRVHGHRRVPPNDGGLSLGQLAIAAARGSSPCV